VDQTSPLARIEAAIDSVYFLMYDGWEQELESNRWHYARRWARHFPVTLLQPRQRFGRFKTADATEAIDNVEVLTILEPGRVTTPLRALAQAAQVMEHMSKRAHARPLLWCYNPLLVGLYAAAPALARVYHASENYFDFEGMPETFYRDVESALRLSDVVIPVSSGVAESIRARVPEASVQLVTNGCDTSHYQPTGALDPTVAADRGGFERVAVFAGNINDRLDFGLIAKAAEDESTLLVFAGPAGSLAGADRDDWRRILRRGNVRHLEKMSFAGLAALYRSADLGLIPYRNNRFLVRNGFPLKTLEMAATGLPVVASRMDPIAGLASAIVVAEDDGEFLEAFTTLSRSSLSEHQRFELLEVAAANDYDRKFEQVVGYVTGAIPQGRGVHTRLDDLLGNLGYESWRTSSRQIVRLTKPSLPWRAMLLAYEGFAKLVPPETRRRLIPAAIRDWARNRTPE
jgi:glycosyltransferase involved in cell wall biosynthesis